MPTRPGASRPRRRLAFFGRHSSFANLTALLGLFVALARTPRLASPANRSPTTASVPRTCATTTCAVAASAKDTVRGTDLRDGDLQGKDVRDNTLTGADVKESSLGAVPSAQDAQTLAGKPPSAFPGSDKQLRTGLIKLMHGDTKTVASSGPFTWKAACSDAGGGNTGLTVTLESTEANGFAGDFGAEGPCLCRPARRPPCSTLPTPAPLQHRLPTQRRRAQRSRASGPRLRRPKRGRHRLRGQRHPLA
jgi:hypothetical protein